MKKINFSFNILFSFIRIALFFFLFFWLNISASFGQDMIWTTMSGSQWRNIPLNSIRAEITRVSNRYSFFWFDRTTPYRDRAEYRSRISKPNDLRNDNPYRNQTLQKIHWLDGNQNFVFADHMNMPSFGIDSVIITIVNKDRVYQITFQNNNPRGTAYQIQNNRYLLDQTLDSWLSGMVSSSQANNQDNRPAFTVVNRTGYTITELYVAESASNNIGSNILNNSLTNGQSIVIRLGQQLNVINQYDIMLVDIDGDTYIKVNVRITQNSTITFTFDDLYY